MPLGGLEGCLLGTDKLSHLHVRFFYNIAYSSYFGKYLFSCLIEFFHRLLLIEEAQNSWIMLQANCRWKGSVCLKEEVPSTRSSTLY